MKKSFIFPGQGSQKVGMAKEFYDNFEVAKNVFAEVNEALEKDLTKIMFEGPDDLLMDTENAQPAIMTASIAILKVLEQESRKKIENLCSYVAGHSLGEYSALCASGVLSLSDTAKLLKVRGKAFAEAGKKVNGGMVALVGATIDQAIEVADKARMKDEICQVANDNTVGQVVISGNTCSIDKVIEVATEMGIKKAIKLAVSGAFHSKLMEPAVENMKEILSKITVNNPLVPIVANYTANIEDQGEIIDNLLKQITGTVRWRETMLLMEKNDVEQFVEIGSSKVLTGMVGKTCLNVKSFALDSIEKMKEFIENM